MNRIQITKTAKLEDLAMWSLCKNILEHFSEYSHYIKKNDEDDSFDVDTFLGINLHLFRGETELFAEEDLDTFEKVLRETDEEKIGHLTISA